MFDSLKGLFVKFIHAADIHLDSPLTGLAAYADAPVAMLRTATRDAFTNLIDAAIAQTVDFLVLAGDLYDGAWKDHNTGIYFCKEMGRLKKAGIPVYLLFGNHDAESEMTKKLLLPDTVHVFEARRPSSFQIEHLKVVLHGRSFKDAATTENLVTSYPPAIPGMFNIGVLHTALEGNSAHANYAPCSLDELHASGYQYWALGHVHEFQTWQGAATIVFPGNLQGRHVRETGARGAVLVTVANDGAIRLERLLVDVLRWHHLEVDAAACTSFEAVVRAIGLALEQLVAAAPVHLPSAVRISLVGRCSVHGALFGLERQLRLEVLALAAALGSERLWVEKVVVRTTAIEDSTALAGRADALGDLQEILAQAHDDPAFLAVLQADLLALVSKAPLELQASVPYFSDIRAGTLAALVQDVRPGLLAHLAATE